MAGYAYGLDGGGAIPDDETVDETGMVSEPGPAQDQGAIPDDQSQDNGPATVPAQAQPQQQDQGPSQDQGSQSGVDFNAAHVPANAKRIIQYLLGADAAPAEAANKMVQATRMEHPDLSQDDAQLVAVHKAMEQGGPEAAHQLLQYNRGAYNYKAAVATSLINGSSQGKAPDLQGAADAATEASKNLLDGSNARFVASPDGTITATVKPPGADAPASYNLTPQQFGQLFDVGGSGQFDRMLGTGGLPGALARLTSQGAQSPTAPQDGASATQKQEDKGTQAAGEDSSPSSEGGDVIGLPKKSAGPQYDEDLVERANRAFPWISQAQQKERWLAQTQEARDSQEEANKSKQEIAKTQANSRITYGQERAQGQVGAAHERRLGVENSAQTRADGYAKVQQQKAQLALQKMAQQSQDNDTRNRINLATKLINNPNWATQDPKERDAIIQRYGLDKLGVPLSTAPQAGAPPNTQTPPAAAATPPQQQQQPGALDQAAAGKKFYNGKWYSREEYRQAFGK